MNPKKKIWITNIVHLFKVNLVNDEPMKLQLTLRIEASHTFSDLEQYEDDISQPHVKDNLK